MKKSSRRGRAETYGARRVVLRPIGYPFRLRGDPQPSGIEIDDDGLFQDYAREQWIGSVVRKGMYLFDRYVMPDFAFHVLDVVPEGSVITRDTEIVLQNGRSGKPNASLKPVPFEDIIGHDDVKSKCQIILRYLNDPTLYEEWAPRAVLFYGPPGTGKTMTAVALASKAKANVIIVKAPDLIGAHVGDGARRIAAVFDEARGAAPSIVFIDEIDAIALHRSFQSVRGDVSEIVTTLLGEIDRTVDDVPVVVIAATNAIELLDPAVRSRFDAAFEFRLPTDEERYQILEMYASRLPLPVRADLKLIARRSHGLSGRDLRNRLLKEAFHLAVVEGLDHVPARILMSVLQKIMSRKRPDYVL